MVLGRRRDFLYATPLRRISLNGHSIYEQGRVSKLIAHDCDASHSMIDSTRNPLNRTLAKRHAERGSTLVEFSLVILPLIGFLFLTLDVAWIFFGWACIQEAAREGGAVCSDGVGTSRKHPGHLDPKQCDHTVFVRLRECAERSIGKYYFLRR